ncbi:MAG: acyltransferase family protein [Sulfurovaceae bacterium]|nr:acyltransferase family protein [Sulfurovaceae bacterium]
MNFLPIVNHSLAYNKSIDGLRGIAILLVLLFHIYPKEFSFGYVGVDIFFVLSGFLITQIIYTKLISGTFSFKEFYRNRVRRIFPAMIIVLIFSFIVGYLFLFPKELELFSKHITSSALFYENFRLIGESGYWDEASTKKPLLHFWSLSIEEQFYIFWPMLIFVLYKFKFKLVSSLSIVFIALLILPQFIDVDPFYHSLSRFWELCFGGLVFAVNDRYDIKKQIKKLKPVIYLFFFISIGFGYENVEFSIFKTFFIAISTGFLILLLLYEENEQIFSSIILIFLGLISFPLYLWHYAIIGYAYTFGLDVQNIGLGIAFVSIVLSYLTYRLIEIKARRQNSYYFMFFLMVIVLMLATMSHYVYKTRGLPNREYIKSINNAYFDRAPFKDANGTKIIENIAGKNPNISHIRSNMKTMQKPFFVLIGDSHAYSIYDALSKEILKHGYRTLCISNNAIPPFIETISSLDKKIKEKNKTIYQVLEKLKPKKVIWVSRGQIYATKSSFLLNEKSDISRQNFQIVDFYDNLEATFKYFNQNNIELYFVLENPEMGFYPEECLKRPFFKFPYKLNCSISKESFLKRQQKFIYNVKRIASKYKNIKIIDTQNIFCDNKECHAIVNGKLIYFDDNHLNLEGAKLQSNEIVRQIFK